MALSDSRAITRKLPLLFLGALFLVLVWLGNGAVLAGEKFGYSYSDHVSYSRLLNQVLAIGPVEVVGKSFTAPFFGWINWAMLITLVAMGFSEELPPRKGTVTRLAIVLLSLPLAALAFFAAVDSARLGADGEWLLEGWPMFEVFFVWTLAMGGYMLAKSGLVAQPGFEEQVAMT